MQLSVDDRDPLQSLKINAKLALTLNIPVLNFSWH